jgi:LCP family protein required for cell wall assembly
MILSIILLVAVGAGVGLYAYMDFRLKANSVPFAVAAEDAFNAEIAEIPSEIEIISEEEYLKNENNDDNGDAEDADAESKLIEELRSEVDAVMETTTPQSAIAAADEEADPMDDEDDDNDWDVVTFEQDDAIFERVEISDRIYNVLLMGDDARIHEPRARSDTMILLSYHRDSRELYITSFMRDTLVPTTLEGTKWGRINSIYAAGGPGRAINVLNNLFSLDVQKYAIVRFNSVFALVDELGGLEIELTQAEARVINGIFPEYGTVKEGSNLLNGRQGLAYSRMRKIDSDLNRTARQRNVLRVTFNRGLETKSIKDMETLARFMFDNVETNIPLSEILTMGYEVLTGPKPTVKEFRVPVDGSFNYGRYYGANILTLDFRKNITALHEYIYGSSAGVRIPNFKAPTLDGPAGRGETEAVEDAETTTEEAAEGAAEDAEGTVGGAEGELTADADGNPINGPADGEGDEDNGEGEGDGGEGVGVVVGGVETGDGDGGGDGDEPTTRRRRTNATTTEAPPEEETTTRRRRSNETTTEAQTPAISNEAEINSQTDGDTETETTTARQRRSSETAEPTSPAPISNEAES